MTTRGHLKLDIRTGAPIEDDDDVLRDGQRIFVPLNMRDGMSEMQREVMADKAARLSPVVDSTGGTAGLHRPGPRYLRDANDAREQAYLDSKRSLQDAWRQPAAAQQEGDQCTVREGGTQEGSPGHLRMVNGELRCVPDQRRQDALPRGPVLDAAEGDRIKDAAWRQMVDDLKNAWRQRIAAPPPTEATTDTARVVPPVDAQAIKDAAYREMCNELEGAWRA